MSKENNKTYIIGALILAGLLIFGGINLITESDRIYNDSSRFLEKILKEDSTLKAKITEIPQPQYSIVKEGYTQAVAYFLIAIGVLVLGVLLPRLQALNISPTAGISITLKDLQQQLDVLKVQNNDLTQKTVNTSAQPSGLLIGKYKKIIDNLHFEHKEQPETKQMREINGDPQKNRWGENPEMNGRVLSADILPGSKQGFYNVNLRVKSIESSLPLSGFVRFHLHNTFPNPDPAIYVINGEANLTLYNVCGGFTVGAVSDNGLTKLELDLAQLKDAPKEFLEK